MNSMKGQRKLNAKRNAKIQLCMSAETEILVKVLGSVTFPDLANCFLCDDQKSVDVFSKITALKRMNSVEQGVAVTNCSDLRKLAQYKLNSFVDLLSVISAKSE